MAGEAAAQVAVGDDLDFKEIAAEGIGGFGNNASMMAVNKLIDARNMSNIELASKLTDINFIVNEKESDTRISQWTNNMVELGKINEDQGQRIQKNLGLSKDADNMLDFGRSKNRPKNKRVKARLMELLAAKEEYTADTNRKEVFSQKIKDINAEIAYLIENKSLAPDNQRAKIEAIFSPGVEVGDVRAGLSQYVIDGKSYTKQEFLKKLGKMSVRELTKFNGKVVNDEEVANQLNDKINAVQKPETESVDARQQAAIGTGVGTEVSLEETPGVETTETEQVASPIQDNLQENETVVQTEEDAKGRVLTRTKQESVRERDGMKVTKFKFNRSDKATDQRNDTFVSEEVALAGTNFEINPEDRLDLQEGETATYEISEIREGDTGVGASVKFTTIDADGNKIGSFQGDVTLVEKTQPETQEVVPTTKPETIVAVAPFFDTTIESAEQAQTLRDSEGYQQYKNNLTGIGQQLGLEVEVEEGIGGYKNDAGTEIVEISNRVVLKNATIEQAEEYAALAAALAPETQESSIAAEYVEEGSEKHNGNEYILNVSDTQGVMDALKKAGITDYSINENTGEVSFINIFDFDDPTLQDKIGIFVEELEANNITYDKQNYRAVNSVYVDQGKRKEILGRTASQRSADRQTGSDVYSSLLQAIENDAKFEGITTEEYFPGFKELQASATAAAQEVADLETTLGTPTNFQLDDTSITPERKKALEDRALKLMEKVQPELSEKSFTVEETNLPTTPIVVTENTKLANKVGKMSVKDLQDKRINLVMADLLKVDEKRMGGAFFGLQEGIYGKQIAWASITPNAAKDIVRGSVNSDYTVVYMMAPEAVDSNVVLLDTLTDKIKQSPNRKAIFNAMMDDLSNKKFGKKTEVVNNIAKNSKTLVEFTVEFEKLDVDTKAAIFKSVLPKAGVNAGTEIGKLFQAEGISQESVREENIEQFAKDLPMGAMTMVLKITDSNGNRITKNNIDDAIVMPEQQRAEDIKEHRNYPVYIRGEVVAMLSDTVPFWSVNKNILSTIDAKIDGLIETKTTPAERSKGAADTKPTTAKQARSAAMRKASMTAGSSFVVQPASKTNYEKFISKLTKSFPNTEVVTDQQEFDNLVSDLSAKKLMTKNQKVYGAVYNGKLYLNPALENYDTPVHEFGHLWLNTAKELAPDTYKKGLSLVEGTEYESDVRNSKAYKKVIKQMIADGATETEINEYILEEALATAIGNKGDSFASAAKTKNFRAWLNELFDFVKKLTGISKLTSEQIQDLSLDEFTEAVVVDLLSENKAFENAETAVLSDSLQLMTTSNSSMIDIIDMARDKGFSDASIKEVLKGRGFKVADITAAMEVKVDAFTQLPEAFGRVEGGIKEGMKLFKEVRDSLSKFVTPDKTMAEVRQKAMDLIKENPIYKAQPEQTQMEILVDFDKTLNTRSNVAVQKEIAAIKNNIRQRKINSQNLKAAQIQLRNYIRKALPKSKTYTQAQINRLISRVTKSTVDTFQADTEYVMKIVDQQKTKMKNALVMDMLKLVKAKAMTAFTKSGKRRAKGLSREGTAYFKAVKQILTADIDDLNKIQQDLQNESTEINNLIEKQNDGQKLTQKEQAKVNLALAMDTFGDVSNMSLEEVQDLMQQLKDVRAESIATFKSRRQARVEANKKMKEEADAQIKDTNPMLFDADGNVLNRNERNARKNQILSHFRNFEIGKGLSSLSERMKFSTAKDFIQNMKQMFQHLGTLSNVLDRVTQGKNFFTKNIYDALNRMDDLNNGGLFQTQKKLDDIANTIPGITKGVKTDIL